MQSCVIDFTKRDGKHTCILLSRSLDESSSCDDLRSVRFKISRVRCWDQHLHHQALAQIPGVVVVVVVVHWMHDNCHESVIRVVGTGLFNGITTVTHTTTKADDAPPDDDDDLLAVLSNLAFTSSTSKINVL